MNKTKILAVAAFVALTAACTSKKTETEDTAKIVSVSIEPQRWIMEQIGGDRLKVVSFLPGDANPENFDPPMSALKNAAESVIYMRMGHLPWENNLIKRVVASNPDIKVVDTSAGIELIHGTHDHGHAHPHMDGVDPHTWSSVKNAKIIAANMYEAIKEADAANAEYYTKRYEKLSQRLDSLDNAFTERLAPIKGESVLVWHPSLSYFARDYGINQISIGMENKETTPRGMQRQMDIAGTHNPIAFFVQPQMDGAKSEAVVKKSGARKFVIHPLSYNWLAEMESITDVLTDSISK